MSVTVMETIEIVPGQLTKEVISRGTGTETPKRGDHVVAHYTGRLLDGSVFDSSVTRGKPFEVSFDCVYECDVHVCCRRN